MFGQLIISGIGTGLIVALPAIALSLTFGILRFPNFAIGAMLTFAAYIAWALNTLAGVPLVAAAALPIWHGFSTWLLACRWLSPVC